MSQLETTRSIGELAERARQAYEEKRIKDCLDLTRAILLIDPENTEAQMMRSSIRSEMHQDIENARALLRQAKTTEGTAELPFFDKTEQPPDLTVRSARPSWAMGAGLVVVLGLSVFVGLRFRVKSEAVPKPPAQPAAVSVPTPAAVMLDEPLVRADLLPSAPVPVSTPETAKGGADAAVRPVSPARTAPAVAAATGILAVSSLTSVDIYKDEAYIGSAPVSLELPAGTHMLEYRHGNLRTTQTHIINGNETTRARITFDVTVQINSRPWAEVFLDGVERRALGQTPLSNVRVPIGGVLAFENPAFQKKTYRVTGNESGIRMVFP